MSDRGGNEGHPLTKSKGHTKSGKENKEKEIQSSLTKERRARSRGVSFP
jgi:hypothetical protein